MREEGGREEGEKGRGVGKRARGKDDMGQQRRESKWMREERMEETSTTFLLEDLSQHPVSLHAFYVLSDDGLLFVSLLFLQPLHHCLVIVPEVRLQGGRGHMSSSTSQTSEHSHTPANFQ